MTTGTFRGKRTLGLRLWHWLNVLVLTALLATVLLRDELVGVREHRALIQEKLSALGVVLTKDQATAVARLYLDRLWGWHINLGLLLAGLLALRVVVAVTAPAGTGLLHDLRAALQGAKTEHNARYVAAVKAGHAALYAMLGVLVATGVVLAYGKAWGVPDGIRHTLGDVHEATMYGVIAFAVAHIFGVVRAEKTSDSGLVSDMINGG